MPVYPDLIRMSGIDPYHSNYNPNALDDFTFDSERPWDSRDVILSLGSHVISDAQATMRRVNDAYRKFSGEDEDYCTLTCILEKIINHNASDIDELENQLIEEVTEERL